MMSIEQKVPLLHEVAFREAQPVFIDHAHQVIFTNHESRTLQKLPWDYQSLLGTFDLTIAGTKSVKIKENLVQEVETGIHFYARSQKNQTEVVYDTSDGDSYIEVAIFSLEHQQWVTSAECGKSYEG